MSATTHYNLHLTDDDSETFQDWREAMNGTTDSNMTKIDTALYDKAAKSTTVSGTLAAASWSGSEAPYTQTISVTGLTAAQNGYIGLPQTATASQRTMAMDAVLDVTGQAAGSLTISAFGEKPTADIPVLVTLLG